MSRCWDRGRGWRDATRRAGPSAEPVPPSRSSQQLRSLAHLGHNAREDVISVALAVDQCETLRLGDGERSIALTNPAMKSQILGLEPSLILHRSGVARACAREADLFGQIEKKREVRRERISRPGIQRTQLIEIDEPPESLIRERRVGEAIAEHDRSPRKRRLDDFDDMLAAR